VESDPGAGEAGAVAVSRPDCEPKKLVSVLSRSEIEGTLGARLQCEEEDSGE
jgi:hypothetical protein